MTRVHTLSQGKAIKRENYLSEHARMHDFGHRGKYMHHRLAVALHGALPEIYFGDMRISLLAE